MKWTAMQSVLRIGALGWGALALLDSAPTQADGVRAQAVVHLTFDEDSGDALDSAAAGAAKDNGVLVNAASRIRSPFWGQSGKKALLLDGAARQFVQIADSPDLDRPTGVSFSLLFVNLHPYNDNAYHGLVAKRDDAASKVTNFGINYNPAGDAFQVYLNDGSGFKTGTYAMAASAGFRQPVFLTATYQVGDAPAPDVDEDQDDVLIRLYANGKPVTPKGATGGFAAGNDVWLTDLKVATLINDAPLTLGSSMPTLEFTSGVIDEFSLFARPLSADEAAVLFLEVAGPNAAAQIADEGTPLPRGPEISNLSLRGLQTGQTTVLGVTGANLLPAPQLVLPMATDKIQLRPGSTAERVEFEVTVPATVAAGHYPVRVQNAFGISGALTVAVDSLPQVPYADSAADKPLTLPVAISGILSGQQQHRVYFPGQKGQRLVIDLECKRFGSVMEPVLELRNPRGAPLSIAWGRPQNRGDARIATTLLADGVYSVDLHDLAYNAPGQNSYRLKIGDLKLIDSTFPPVLAAGGQTTVAAIGPGIEPSTTLAIDPVTLLRGMAQNVPLPAQLGAVAPAPTLSLSEASEALEAPQPNGAPQPLDARFAEQTHVPRIVSGRISQPSEVDQYLLTVTPGMALNLSAESGSLRTPLEPQLHVLSAADRSVLAASEDRPVIEFKVPEGVTSVVVTIRDVNRRGGAEYLYRLRMIPSGQPDFSLSVGNERISLPRDGGVAVRVEVNRAGYNGPVALSLVGGSELAIEPAEIPAGVSKALVRISARNAAPGSEVLIRRVRLFGQSIGLEPPLRRVGTSPPDPRLTLAPAERSEMTVALTAANGAALNLGALPTTWFKGMEYSVPATLKFNAPGLEARSVRLSLITTEAARTRVDPTDPTQQRRLPLPLVRSLPEQSLQPGETSLPLRIAVPVDVAESPQDAILRAEFVPHPFSDKVVATAYSAPFRLQIERGVSVQLEASALAVVSKTPASLKGMVKRAAGFSEPVEVTLINLPAGYSAPKVTVPAGQEQFEIMVTPPEITAAADIPNVALRIATAAGATLLEDVKVATKAMP